jgi:hypothetical protein
VAVVASILAGCGVGLFKAEAESAFDSKGEEKGCVATWVQLVRDGENERKGVGDASGGEHLL